MGVSPLLFHRGVVRDDAGFREVIYRVATIGDGRLGH
jgi:hypothetical protein